jgi:hypothetical protein
MVNGYPMSFYPEKTVLLSWGTARSGAERGVTMGSELQIVYVLHATSWNRYAKMTWLSAMAVRRLYPQALHLP